ncbi:TRAP transporter substrate-binding protein DctP [Acuticoccus sp.]|uniref:TRAP transporter substrate-binding protein n=1 Tax=Acuticoccus sp. TaxID=1904378 RepID=UPI003B527AAF
MKWERCAFGLGMVIAVTCAGPALAERTLRLSLQVATNHPVGQNILYFKEEVEELSGGEIEVEVYDAAQLYKGSEIPQAVGSGAIDMGLVLIDEYAGTIPATGIFSVAFMFPGYEELAKAAAPGSPVRQKIDDLILDTGTRVLWWQDYGPIQLLSNDEPLRMPSDLEGKKVRALGKPSGEFVEAAGGIPVKIGGSEQFMAYQRGTVDVGMTGLTAVQSRNLFEVMDYATMTNHAQIEFLVVINEDLWQSMSDQEREWMTTAARNAEEKMRAETRQQHEDAAEWLRSNTEMEVIDLTPQEIDAWKEAAAPAIEAFVASAGELGEELVNEVRALQGQ